MTGEGRSEAAPPVGYTLSDLTALFPHAHIESVGEDDELVIYTGLTVDESKPGGSWLRWLDGMFPAAPAGTGPNTGPRGESQ